MKGSNSKIEQPKKKYQRMFFADCLRVIAVHLVIYVHCMLNAADTVGLDDNDAREKKDGICKCLS